MPKRKAASHDVAQSTPSSVSLSVRWALSGEILSVVSISPEACEWEEKAWHSMYKIQKIDYVPHPIRTQNKLAQHTTPIAKTHRTATLFSSEPTKNLKMFISIHHRNITISSRSPQHHHPSLRHHSITDTEQRHHQHKTKASPTYHQNITTQSLHITETRPRHHRHII